MNRYEKEPNCDVAVGWLLDLEVISASAELAMASRKDFLR